jgi:N-methylhydantoinase B
MVDLRNDDVVHVNLPGGGGYGDALERAPDKVLWDVIDGYVTPEDAESSYGVVVRYRGNPDALVKMPADWIVDEEATKRLRERMKAENRNSKKVENAG